MSAWRAVVWILRRDIQSRYRDCGELFQPLLFFILVIILFPLAVSPEPNLLKTIAPGIIIIAALLANLLAAETFLKEDYQDGSLEQLALSPQPMLLIIYAKVLANWLLYSLPLLITVPLMAYLFNLSTPALVALLAGLGFASVIINLLGGLVAALLLPANKGSALLALLTIPLYVPVLIFSAEMVANVQAGLDVSGLLAILAACAILAVCLIPLAISGVLRMVFSV